MLKKMAKSKIFLKQNLSKLLEDFRLLFTSSPVTNLIVVLDYIEIKLSSVFFYFNLFFSKSKKIRPQKNVPF